MLNFVLMRSAFCRGVGSRTYDLLRVALAKNNDAIDRK